MASSVYTPAPEALASLPDAQRLIEQLRAQLAEELAARARLERSLAELDLPIRHVGDSVEFLSDAFEELSQVFHGYRDALISLRTTHTPAAAQLADLREMEAVCDLEFLEREVPKVCARSRHEAVQAAELVRAMKEFAHIEQPEEKPVRG
jgi:ABC-type transporter Mla subunit MlaD